MTAALIAAFLAGGLAGEWILEGLDAGWTYVFLGVWVAVFAAVGMLIFPRGSEIVGTTPWWGFLGALEGIVAMLWCVGELR